jgi:FixJ family two-component response regulator
MVREILIVDGDSALHAALSLQFSDEPVALTPVHGRIACLDRIAGRMPSLVLVDLDGSQTGLDLLRDLKASRCRAPVVALSARATVRIAVEAMKSGACDVFEAPFDFERMTVALRNMLGPADQPRGQTALAMVRPRSRSRAQEPEDLTRREREVLAEIAGGASNKEVGRLLGISPRTVEVHRARIMTKLGARNAADLVRIVLSEDRRERSVA